MRRVFKKGIAIALAAAMVITAAPANQAGAAKKPSMQKKATVAVGKTVTIKIKNSSKKAKVSFKSNKPKIAKIAKQVKKGAKASVKVKGLKKGSAKITATYKAGKLNKKFVCTVTVGKKAATKATEAPATAAPATEAPATAAPATATPAPKDDNNGGATATDAPATDVPATKVPSTPRPSATPTNAPKNTELEATKIEDGVITVDGTINKDEWENASKSQNLLENSCSIRGKAEAAPAVATVRLAWTDGNYIYAAVEADKAMDEVKLFVDNDGDATNNNAQSETATLSADKKSAEVAIQAGSALDATKGTKVEVQVKCGDATINYFDSYYKLVYDAENNKFVYEGVNVADIKAGKDDSVLGALSLLPSLAQAKTAYFTDKQSEILAESGIATAPWENEAEEGAEAPAVKTKKINFVDTKYWTDAYTANGSGPIFFPNVNIPEHMGNADKVELAARGEDGKFLKDENGKFVSSPDLAKAYIIWDKQYLYVLFDVKDTDVSPNDEKEPYISDSTEFFLDEDNSQPGSYTQGGDEVQIRIGAKENAFSSNEYNTGNYDVVGHASKIIKDGEKTLGYQTQYIIKLNNEHTNGDMMGMELQINDCFTEYSYIEAVDAEGNPIYEPVLDAEGNPVIGDDGEPEMQVKKVIDETKDPTSARAATVTAYDTSNNCWQDPSKFGRVKLINKDEAGNENPNPGPGVEDPTPEFDCTATQTTATIAIDGQEDAAYEVAEAMDFTSRIIDKDVEDTNASGVSATAKMLWDENNLYGFIKVKDANISAGAADAHKKDGIEILFDEDNCGVLNETDKNDWINEDAFQYRLTGLTKDEAGVAQAPLTQAIVGAKDKNLYKDNIETKYAFTEDGYNVEFKITFKTARAVDAIMGFDLIVQDCAVIDGADKREAELFLVETEASKSYWNNKAEFGKIKLVAAPAPKLLPLTADNVKADGNTTVTPNDDGSVTISIKGQYSGAWLNLPTDLKDNYSKIIITYKNGDASGFGRTYQYTDSTKDESVSWGGNLIGEGTCEITLDSSRTLNKIKVFKSEVVTEPCDVTITSVEFK